MLTTRRRTVRRPKQASLASEAQRLLDLLNSLGSTTFRQLLWQRSSELDLTFAQSQVLFYVGDHPRCPMGDVAKAFGVTLPAITHIVDRLEEKGFATRGAAPGDRRIYALELTAPGRALVDELHTIRRRPMEHVLTRMSLTDRRRLIRGLEALAGAASSIAEEGRG
jgi:DNA-binding MarR family transcriptional regulator